MSHIFDTDINSIISFFEKETFLYSNDGTILHTFKPSGNVLKLSKYQYRLGKMNVNNILVNIVSRPVSGPMSSPVLGGLINASVPILVDWEIGEYISDNQSIYDGPVFGFDVYGNNRVIEKPTELICYKQKTT